MTRTAPTGRLTSLRNLPSQEINGSIRVTSSIKAACLGDTKKPTAAASQILRERFGVFARQEVIPSELVWALEKYRLTDQYPVLLSGLLGPSKWIGGTTIIQMDRMLARDATPELEQQFRDALAHRLELRLGMGSYQDDVLHIARIAVRWGVRQGIDALLRAPAHERPSIIAFLREHMDLPADPDEAWRVLERTRGAWRWDPQRRQFESPTH